MSGQLINIIFYMPIYIDLIILIKFTYLFQKNEEEKSLSSAIIYSIQFVAAASKIHHGDLRLHPSVGEGEPRCLLGRSYGAMLTK